MKAPVLKAFRHLLRPIVRVLLRNGVTWKEFAELGKEVFVDVARHDYGIDGRPTNVARVALMTGLRRHEVTRIKNVLAGAEKAQEPAPSRISQILTAWHVDPDFLAADGTPAVLPLAGEGASVVTLLKRYAGDMPHSAVLKELELLGLVEAKPNGYRVTSRDYIRSAADPDLLRQAAVALHDHATTLAHNVDSTRTEPPRFERMATHRALPRRHLKAFHALLELEGQAFLERIDAWLSERATAATRARGTTRQRTVRAGVGLYLVHDDERGERQ